MAPRGPETDLCDEDAVVLPAEQPIFEDVILGTFAWGTILVFLLLALACVLMYKLYNGWNFDIFSEEWPPSTICLNDVPVGDEECVELTD